MRIKRIEIEGFKSYSTKQVVDDLDPQFNAITGLNGSGKSNILDAICFLLGITNLQQVRAHTLTDLVYKQGQGGINRATVTITFDNNVPEDQQPVGMQKYKEIVVRRQIILNGRNTYQINGQTATNQRVTDMFRTVGINVNNPHFLIMQGRITKVLNMKPVEILSMIEEAAGVRMYENKKQNCLKLIEKKEAKVQEINRMMDEDIVPRVEKLQRDRSDYLEYQAIEKELEELTRKLTAFDYFTLLKESKRYKERANDKKLETENMQVEIRSSQENYEQQKKESDEMERNRQEQATIEQEELENALKGVRNEETQVDSERGGLESEQKELKVGIDRKQKSINNDKKMFDKKSLDLQRMESEIGTEERRYKDAQDAETNARQKLEALAMGMITNEDGKAMTLDEQITSTRTQLSDVETNCKKTQLKITQLGPSLNKKRIEYKQLSAKSSVQENQKENLLKEYNQFEQQLKELKFDENQEQDLRHRHSQFINERERLDNEIDKFEMRNSLLQFNYTDPHPNFNQSSVKGVVAKLFKIRDKRFATALEVAAGGKLFQIVVDKSETGRLLIERGKLNRRVTIIPLDKIEVRGVNANQMKEAQRLVGNRNVFLAKDLVEYDPELEPAMNSVFGTTLICENMDQGKLLAFNERVLCRTVTVSGEDFNPAGVLKGGSRPQSTPLLEELEELRKHYQRREQVVLELKGIDDQLNRMHPFRQQYEQLKSGINTTKRKLEAMNEALKDSPLQILENEIHQSEQELAEAQEFIANTSPGIQALKEKLKKMEQQKKNEKNYQEQEKKKFQKELEIAQRELKTLKDTFSSIRDTLPALREEIKSLEQTLQDDGAEIEGMREKLQENDAKIQAINEKAEEVKSRRKEAQQKLEDYNKKMRAQDKAHRAKIAQIEEIKKNIKKLEVDLEELKKDMEECEKNYRECKKQAENLRKAHKFISEQEHLFNVTGSHYDFQAYSHEIGKREINQRQERKKQLLQTVNPKAMNLLGTAEEKCNELKKKREQLDKDKTELYKTIEQLDAKKRHELIIAHQQINADFGSIYSTLLPGATAELVPPSGEENCLAGLEFRIAFSGKYKESLTELSGGQRSLVALSLILAMLKFKPAPFYILDEVDAALDLSHTEHIGKVIKNHFKESQFIVVSLKDGFFNNANVLFRTKFIDGTSNVTRIQNH